MVTVYDNGGKTIDRFTVVVKDEDFKEYGKAFFGMSENARVFNQFCGHEIDGLKEGSHLGKKLNYIPDAVKQGLEQRGII